MAAEKRAEELSQTCVGEPSHGSLGRGIEPKLRPKQPLLSCSQGQYRLDWERQGIKSGRVMAPPEQKRKDHTDKS